MNSFRFRLRVAELESREVPSVTAGEASEAIAYISTSQAALSWISQHLDSKAVYQAKDSLITSLPAMARQNGDAVHTLQRFLVDSNTAIANGEGNSALSSLMNQATGAIAQGLANASYSATTGINMGASPESLLPPAPPPPPAPVPVFDDSQLSNSLPDTAEGFIDIGEGLKIKDVVEGVGLAVTASQSVTVDYTGWLLDGTQFDSSRTRGEPITFSLDQVIVGWQRAIPGMKPGGIRQLYVPAALGYGAAGSGSSIPPNSDLVFEVRLRSSTDPAPTSNSNSSGGFTQEQLQELLNQQSSGSV